jgi:hypothetical protein
MHKALNSIPATKKIKKPKKKKKKGHWWRCHLAQDCESLLSFLEIFFGAKPPG